MEAPETGDGAGRDPAGVCAGRCPGHMAIGLSTLKKTRSADSPSTPKASCPQSVLMVDEQQERNADMAFKHFIKKMELESS